MREVLVPKAPPEHDIWSFYRFNKGYELVPCNSIKTFMLLVQSPETYKVMNYPEVPLAKCLCIVYGPPSPVDANEYEDAMNGRLRSRYVLTAEEIHDRDTGLKESEKRLLMSAMRKKSNTDTRLFARAMNLRRVS